MTKRKMYARMITASLLRRRSRMIVALLAIMIGATILSGLVTIYYDVPRQMGAQFRSYGANIILTSADNDMTLDDIDRSLSVINDNEIVGIAPYHYESVRIRETPVVAAATDLEGAKKTSPFWSVSGEWPSNPSQVMVGKNIASTYGLKIGETTTISYTPQSDATVNSASGSASDVQNDIEKDFIVTGILDTGGSEEDYVYMSLNDMASFTDKDINIDICELSISASGDKLSGYIDDINAYGTGVVAKVVKKVAESETAVLGKLQGLVLLVTVIVLALTMICVATTMTAVVTERRQEIGLRKSLGAYDSDIIKEFMGEGLVLGALGGLLGAILGFVFAQEVSVNVFNSSITLQPLLLPVTVIASIVVTGIACLLPIKSATKIDPAVVLKGE